MAAGRRSRWRSSPRATVACSELLDARRAVRRRRARRRAARHARSAGSRPERLTSCAQRDPSAATRAWRGSTRSCARRSADELERLSDPRLGLVTVTGVEVSADLRQATVYYSALGASDEAGVRGSCRNSRRSNGSATQAALQVRGAAPARRARSPGAAEVHARAHVPRGSRRSSRASASRRSSATCTATSRPSRERGMTTTEVDAALAARRAGDRRAPTWSRSRATSTPTVTRSARCSACSTCCAPPGATSSRRSRRRSWSRRTTASSPGSTCSRSPSDFPAEPDVMVTFDCGSLGRLGDLEPAAKAARELDRARPPRLEHALRHDQRHRPGRGRERRARAPARRASSASPLDRRRRGRRSTPRWSATPGASSTRPPRPRVFELARELVEFDVPVARLVAPALRGAPLRVPPAARRGAGHRRARRRATLRVDRGHPGHARRATASPSTRSKGSSTSSAARPRPRSPAC